MSLKDWFIGSTIKSLGSTISETFLGLFSTRQKRAETLSNIIVGLYGAMKDAGVSQQQQDYVAGRIIEAETSSDNWLASSWRPMLMYLCIGIVCSYWFFGYMPPHFNDTMSPMMAEIFGLIKIGMGGYMGARTIEKVVKTVTENKLAMKLLEKSIEKGAEVLGVDMTDEEKRR